ncbi:TetR/AcrR family transcriptional regulator [Allopusillimonas soli]|uniref:TetR/AcrR family transcriptional regulator n=1 Tax=Allopusillimonas soli TaxID=659016 RepID=A0A853FHC7_9BURK|nr:TetR/AcrR family transcriptional regulator [Allopusillimonas soli]NYT39042.1 TetR/AcrR family transcriptional regulator [Allopusillimonas soli]TEA69524.1 TetR/AcrR family transcriptional regulator [Allopusillimonas soli]
MISDFESFKAGLNLSKLEICRALYRQNGGTIRVKREHVAVRNLVRIIDSALRLTSAKGFHAMSLRDLCADSGFSIGGLYAYIRSKDDLIPLIQSHGFMLTRRTLIDCTRDVSDPTARLLTAVKAHVYLSEILQPWFYFSFMEARNLPAPHKRAAIETELEIENIFHDIISEGMEAGVFQPAHADARLVASLCKAMMQDWYLKRRKYRIQQVDATQYAAFIGTVLERYLLP